MVHMREIERALCKYSDGNAQSRTLREHCLGAW